MASFEALNKPVDVDLFSLNDSKMHAENELRLSKTASVASSAFDESTVGTLPYSGTETPLEASFRRHGRSPRGSLSFNSSFGPGIPLNWELLEITLYEDFLNVFAGLFSDTFWQQIHKGCGTNGTSMFII